MAANNSFGIGPYSHPVEVKTQESSKSMHLKFVFVFDLIVVVQFTDDVIAKLSSKCGSG